jgi:hypothetical protein
MKDEDWILEIGVACVDCRFYEEHQADENISVGVCHLRPPTEWNSETREASFQKVASHDWCGEFELDLAKRVEWEFDKKHKREFPPAGVGK